MNQPVHVLMSLTQSRVTVLTHRMQHLCKGRRIVPIAQLLAHITNATTAHQLRSAINTLQDQIWRLAQSERSAWRNHLVEILKSRVLHAEQAEIRLEAAQWLRVFMQAGWIEKPQQIFVTLVTAATSIEQGSEKREEQRTYVQIMLDCFRSFHYPYPAFPRHQFPDACIFVPLASLLQTEDKEMQETLIAIFSEFPLLDEQAMGSYLLPVALAWAAHPDADYRQRSAHIIAQMRDERAQIALQCLQSDENPSVRAGARCAIENRR